MNLVIECDGKTRVSTWPHGKIRRALLRDIRKRCIKEAEWLFTRLDALHESLAEAVMLQGEELPIVSCFADPERWYVMSTSRVLGSYDGRGV